jgi:protein O-mannosyl-transferase
VTIASGSAAETAEARLPVWERWTDQGRFVAGTASIFFLAFVAYWPALHGQFVWDDIMLVHQNPLVLGKLTLGSIWFRTDFPLSNIAFWAQWHLWGDHPLGYHIVNVLLHATGATLLWHVLRRFGIRGGWLAGALFAVHPVCAASVAWVAELKNTLSLPFYLLSVLWFPHAEPGQAQGRRALGVQPPGWSGTADTLTGGHPTPVRWYALSLVAFLLALFAKTSTVMLPVVLLGCVWWQRGRITFWDMLRTGPFFALALAFGLMSVWFQAHGAIAGATVQTENFWGRLAGAGMALWFYLGKALLPLNLSMIYPRWTINSAAPLSYLPLLLWCGLIALFWGCRRAWGRHPLFGLGCFSVNLLPVLGLLDMYFLALSRVSDHFEYLPLTAVMAMVAAGLCLLRNASLRRCAGTVLVLGLSLLTMQRAHVFANEERLWRDTLAKNPGAWCAHANLGWILADQRKYDEAVSHLTASLQQHPDNAQAHSNLGRVLMLQGKVADAKDHFRAALKLKPDDAGMRRAYASALAEAGAKSAAANELREALRLEPGVELRLELATLFYETGQYRAAVTEYRQVLAAKPDLAQGLSNLAWLLAACPENSVRDGPEAVRLAERACKVTGFAQAQMLGVLAAAYAEAGRFADAVATSQRAIDLATAAGDARFAAMNRRLLELYRAGRPYHEPAASSLPD